MINITHTFSKHPTSHIMPNNKLINKLTELDDFIGRNISLKVSKCKAKEPIISRCILEYDSEHINVYGGEPFTEYDRCVLNAIASLYEYGVTMFTVSMVYRSMTGKPSKCKPSKEQLQAVKGSIDKMRFLHVRIDCREELIQRRLQIDGEHISGGVFDTYLLMLEFTEIKLASGESVTGYEVLQPPVLYEYSKMTGQVITVPSKLLEIPNERNNNKRIEIKSYLLRRVAIMHGKGVHNRKILLSSVLSAVRLADVDRRDRKKIKEYCIKSLAYWRAEQFIKSFTVVKEGCSDVGFEVLP